MFSWATQHCHGQHVAYELWAEWACFKWTDKLHSTYNYCFGYEAVNWLSWRHKEIFVNDSEDGTW